MAMTFFISLVIFGIVVMACLVFARPTYRIGADQIIVLFDAILAGRATTQDWLVFTAVPLRYDPNLEAIRLRCLDLETDHFLGDASRFLFDPAGLAALVEMRKELAELGLPPDL